MALKTSITFPIFAPIFPITTTTTPSTSLPTTEVRFSRWNNANAEKFLRQKRTQQEIEDDIRRYRRFESALSIANLPNSDATTSTTTSNNTGNYQNPNFKSIGTPSAPSLPSIPGKKSKYSRNPNPISIHDRNSRTPHPAFQRSSRKSKVLEDRDEDEAGTKVKIGDDGLSFVMPGAPFEYMYSYTETPKVRPLALREPAIAPFEKETMTRPWTGRKPLPPSKKKLPAFDSFVSPPAKKGVKPVQKPGPFLPGSGPRYVMNREEILGEPLTDEEVRMMVEGCKKSQRQLNIGRDGLTHNMLDNIHAHWKRRRICKIKCKGVCTVDMNNVYQQLEEKTGGKVIYRKGGVVYLFRGRNYNYKTRPRFPLMLWKPVTPVYPRLVQRVPEGLTYEEANDMRRKGHLLTPICKLAKNGVYVNLVKEVREALEACELVRINCQGLNGSDYRKIGAKLKDLVPCVLLSFQEEHILMWRGRNWKSSFSVPADDNQCVEDTVASFSSDDSELSETESVESPEQIMDATSDVNARLVADQGAAPFPEEEQGSSTESAVRFGVAETDVNSREYEDIPTVSNSVHTWPVPLENSACGIQNLANIDTTADGDTITVKEVRGDETPGYVSVSDQHEAPSTLHGCEPIQGDFRSEDQLETYSSSLQGVEPQHMIEPSKASTAQKLASPSVEGVLLLLNEAVEGGRAIVLDDACLDADLIFERSVAFAKIAPPGPYFRDRPRKIHVEKSENRKGGDLEVDEVVPVLEKKMKQIKSSKKQTPRNMKDNGINVVPQGVLGVDELAKLLA